MQLCPAATAASRMGWHVCVRRRGGLGTRNQADHWYGKHHLPAHAHAHVKPGPTHRARPTNECTQKKRARGCVARTHGRTGRAHMAVCADGEWNITTTQTQMLAYFGDSRPVGRGEELRCPWRGTVAVGLKTEREIWVNIFNTIQNIWGHDSSQDRGTGCYHQGVVQNHSSSRAVGWGVGVWHAQIFVGRHVGVRHVC